MNNNGNNEKCAVNDDTTSGNSMIPIISPTSPKESRKVVFVRENEIPHNKYRIESESEEVIEQENEDIDELKSTIKNQKKKQDKKTEKKIKQQSNSESESATEISFSILKYFNLDKYLPGNKFQSTFIDKIVDSTKEKNLKKKLDKPLKNLETEFEKVIGKKVLKMQPRKKNYLPYLKVVNLREKNSHDTLCQNLTTVQNIKQN